MTNEEANKVIAEYMGWVPKRINKSLISGWSKDSVYVDADYFSESLDALVPVWEKMKSIFNEEDNFISSEVRLNKYREEYRCRLMSGTICSTAYTIQEAAAIATAHCIKALSA
jgi:hypothetical protein